MATSQRANLDLITSRCAACDHYRRVEELQHGESRSSSECRTPATAVWEQPRRKFTSANEIARACDETVQVSGPRATVSLRVRHHFLTLSSGTTSVSN